MKIKFRRLAILFFFVGGPFFMEGFSQIPQKPGDLEEVLADYFRWGEWLGKGNEKKAAESAQDFLKTIRKENYLFFFSTESEAFTKEMGLESQRKLYSRISDKMRTVVSKSEQLEQVVFVFHEPEALGGSGAIWLTEEEKPVNPYFSEKDKKTGKLLETLKPIFK